ncbi:AAA family ATPase [Candidatus Poribacteria bacterium]|nr:AAA family ATPase [Candidatus Poribacteria bacterium]MYG05750.1 AAA family ATPase [Candidatus Poribacteria bacterium]MYK22658.1 AAA family ATPase [Candidatus Poribacteria bacterium]
MERIELTSLGQIREADISFGDLTVFVGEQASGKSILLQLVKLFLDAGDITRTLKKHGFDWQKNTDNFLSLYFGEGMQTIWSKDETKVTVDKVDFTPRKALSRRRKDENLFLIPAHRVVTLKDGWPRAFTDYTTSDPYVVKEFSEQLRLLMEAGLGSGERAIFPQVGRMNKTIRDAIGKSIFGEAEVRLDRSGLRKRIVLDVAGSQLPFMVWSTGQREFTPLLLGLYWLMPSGKAQKKDNINWVIIEEPEMGLHPQAISALLLIFLELLRRGYKVIVSTHSAQILELIWAIRFIAKSNSAPTRLRQLLDLNANAYSYDLTETILNGKTFRTYYFSRQDSVVGVKDISTLDAEDPDEAISNWGGLTLFSTKSADVVTEAVWESDL